MNGIMGFDVRRAGWNMHHEVFISDVKRNPGLWGDVDLHGKENLFPLPRREHARLHQMVVGGGRIGREIPVSVAEAPKIVDRTVRKESWRSDRQRVKTELKRYRGLSLADLDNLQVRGFIYS